MALAARVFLPVVEVINPREANTFNQFDQVIKGDIAPVHLCFKKILGLKSHDCHILIQQLLPLALRYLLPDNVTSVLFDLCGYFREVSAKVLYIDDLEKLEERIVMTLCRMEMIFPPGFFTVMVHLVMHLATEAKIGGPVCYRSMWFTERYASFLQRGCMLSL
jgi:hypothetical protein